MNLGLRLLFAIVLTVVFVLIAPGPVATPAALEMQGCHYWHQSGGPWDYEWVDCGPWMTMAAIRAENDAHCAYNHNASTGHITEGPYDTGNGWEMFEMECFGGEENLQMPDVQMLSWLVAVWLVGKGV